VVLGFVVGCLSNHLFVMSLCNLLHLLYDDVICLFVIIFVTDNWKGYRIKKERDMFVFCFSFHFVY